MPEHSDETALLRRATWVGLKTLRQRPTLVDRTEAGEPIFSVRAVRLVLRDNANHFNRLAQCSKCGRAVPGAPILGPADLDRASHSLICRQCVRTAATSPPRPPEDRPVKSAAPTPAASPAPPAPSPPAAPPAAPRPPEAQQPAPEEPPTERPETVVAADVDGDRLAAVENRLQDAMTRLTDLADVQRSESIRRRETYDSAQSDLQAALVQGLAELEAQLTASSEMGVARVVALEDQMRLAAAGVAERLSAQSTELATLAGAVGEVRSEIQRLGASTRELARVQSDLDQRLVDLAGRVSDQPPAGQLLEAVERRIGEAQAAIAGLLEAQRAEVDAALAESRSAFDVTSLEEQLGDKVVALTQMVEVLRHDIEARFDDGVGPELATIAATSVELARARDALEARVGALAGLVDASAGRLQDLEHRIGASVSRLTRMVEAQARELREATKPPPPPEPVDQGDLAEGDLMGALERQLREAERRLARRVVSPGSV